MSSIAKRKFSPMKRKLSPACADRAVAFLRAQHPENTAKAIEAETCGLVSMHTAKKWLTGDAAPNFKATLALICVYGPNFLSAVLHEEPQWVVRATRAERLAALEAEHARLQREIETITRG
ncbi:hypothetical protein [Rhodomicrobium udaipurense]|uniref:Uncharacterized protein n=1 Tax=Rhodomicrobium udaipurense TaxID=1202716 RepID=A0A8I1GED5_9HYPH|nr:hypothetical protein [Rhodomicrobium udaipurense]MBJ7543239.1 hypothetical protein [Rhodomicrobium udaipurense]